MAEEYTIHIRCTHCDDVSDFSKNVRTPRCDLLNVSKESHSASVERIGNISRLVLTDHKDPAKPLTFRIPIGWSDSVTCPLCEACVIQTRLPISSISNAKCYTHHLIPQTDEYGVRAYRLVQFKEPNSRGVDCGNIVPGRSGFCFECCGEFVIPALQ
jgi:hypothetical protein